MDLDEIHHYARLHGVSLAGLDAGEVLDKGLPRLVAWAGQLELPVTWFAVGEDLERPAPAQLLRSCCAQGHEVANHTQHHPYDFSRAGRDAMRREVVEAEQRIEAAVGRRPVGFRAPGYLVDDAVFEVLEERGYRYDSSVFPCPAYAAAKASVMAWQRLRGRDTCAKLGGLSALRARSVPYRRGRPYWRQGTGLWELPIAVTRRLRLPVIGTSLVLGPASLSRGLIAGLAGAPVVMLELHGVEGLGLGDGAAELARYQPDLGLSVDAKLERLSAAVGQLRAAGYRFATARDVVDSLD